MNYESPIWTRRHFGVAAATTAIGALVGCRQRESQPAPTAPPSTWQPQKVQAVPSPAMPNSSASSPSFPSPPTIADSQCGVTEPNILGPYYLEGAPERVDLWPDAAPEARKILVYGNVVDEACRPIPAAFVEEWQADHQGVYDLKGPRFRCVQRPSSSGLYRVATVVPGNYLNGDQYRPAHLHFRIVAPGFQPLVTQLYFAGDRYNAIDPFIRASLVMKPSGRSPEGADQFHYRFVLKRA